MKYVFEPEAAIAATVHGSEFHFPVRRVYCVGRNYAAHAREMGFNPDREAPFFFCKPDNAVVVVPEGKTIEVAYPGQTANYHHEIELVAAIGTAGRNIDAAHANDHIFGYAVGLDMTRRDLQTKMRDSGRPWEVAKAFDESAPLGALYPATEVGHPTHGAIWVTVDGQERQRSDISKLIWSVPEVIANLSQFFELRPGDLIYTGTPEGVAAVTRGQVMRGGIDGLGELHVKVT